jgi:2-dehydro-3-deoxygalactonokinase
MYIKETSLQSKDSQQRWLFYRHYLKKQLDALERQISFTLKDVPVILSGMASSSIGMMELPYASVPFVLDGSGAITHYVPAGTDFPHALLLISGIRSTNDVMRGEETQIIGLSRQIAAKQAIAIFPGTHSKHIMVNSQMITGFQTYMTGELFQIVATHTILQASIEKTPMEAENILLMRAFRKGVHASTELKSTLHALFTVRTGELFGERTRQENYYYLSGLLIGEELKNLVHLPQIPIYLCSSSHLVNFYQAAAEELHLLERTTVLPAQLIDWVVVAGQWQIWQQRDIR